MQWAIEENQFMDDEADLCRGRIKLLQRNDDFFLDEYFMQQS